MGTNYYAHYDCCDKCQRPLKVLHIGKSSWGWAFSIATHPEEELNDWPDWKKELAKPNVRILNEYDEQVTLEELTMTVEDRARKEGKSGSEDRYSQFDPSINLMRHRIGDYCTKHGEGTWDCMVGEFC